MSAEIRRSSWTQTLLPVRPSRIRGPKVADGGGVGFAVVKSASATSSYSVISNVKLDFVWVVFSDWMSNLPLTSSPSVEVSWCPAATPPHASVSPSTRRIIHRMPHIIHRRRAFRHRVSRERSERRKSARLESADPRPLGRRFVGQRSRARARSQPSRCSTASSALARSLAARCGAFVTGNALWTTNVRRVGTDEARSTRRDGKHANRGREPCGEGREIVLVGCQHVCAGRGGYDDEVTIDDIRRAGCPEQRTDIAGLVGAEADDIASPEESVQLDLAIRAVGFGYDRRGRHGHDPELEPCAVVRPDGTVVTLGGDEHARVVDAVHGWPARVRSPPARATRLRAAVSSASVKAPCSASHSATARRPSRTTSARRAAFVIHAETLVPFSPAFARTRARTSVS